MAYSVLKRLMSTSKAYQDRYIRFIGKNLVNVSMVIKYKLNNNEITEKNEIETKKQIEADKMKVYRR